MVQDNQNWLGEGIEGPNIANVFKRTLWQLMFKFEMAVTPSSAGSTRAIPASVWDSWQRFLGTPELERLADGTYQLRGDDESAELRAWICVFDFDSSAQTTPSPMLVPRIIRTSAKALAYYAIEEAPRAAIEELDAGLYPAIQRRIQQYWPTELAIRGSRGVDQGVVIAEDPRPIEDAELEG